MTKIGIFSGTFDPVHKGHIAFALKAAETAGLDKVYFLPESVPRHKEGVTHYAHRIAMLRLATKPYQRLDVLDLPDKQFTVRQTLPRLGRRFKNAEIYLLLGSDVVRHIDTWPSISRLLASTKLIVGIRGGEDNALIASVLQGLVPDRSFHIVQATAAHASSRDIRVSISKGKNHANYLSSLDSYIKQNWLYASVPSES